MRIKRIFFALIGMVALLPMQSQAQELPLPAVQDLRADIWSIVITVLRTGDSFDDKTQPVENGALKEYTFVEKETLVKLDSKGKPTETEINVYQVTEGPQPWQSYRKLISTNGKPLPQADLEKQDREQKKREEKRRTEIERAEKEARKKNGGADPAPMSDEQKQKNLQEAFEFCQTIFDMKVVRREMIENRSTILISLKPKPSVRTQDEVGKLLQHFVIRAWTTEQDHQIARLEAELVDTWTMGFGIAKFKPGSHMLLIRRPISERLWGPARLEGTWTAKLFLLKGMNGQQTSEYSDFKKYSVETILKVATPEGTTVQ